MVGLGSFFEIKNVLIINYQVVKFLFFLYPLFGYITRELPVNKEEALIYLVLLYIQLFQDNCFYNLL